MEEKHSEKSGDDKPVQFMEKVTWEDSRKTEFPEPIGKTEFTEPIEWHEFSKPVEEIPNEVKVVRSARQDAIVTGTAMQPQSPNDSNVANETRHNEGTAAGPLEEMPVPVNDSASPTPDDAQMPRPPQEMLKSDRPVTVKVASKKIDHESGDEDDETMQEIEKLKEQINLMRHKKAAKEAAEEESRRKPYTIFAEEHPVDGEGLSKSGPKTFTFVPNQQKKATYEDYDSVRLGINLSKSGEIKGIAIDIAREAESWLDGAPKILDENDKTGLVKNPPSLQPCTGPTSPFVIEEIGKPGPMQLKQEERGAEGIKNDNPLVAVGIKKGPGGYVSSAAMKQPAASQYAGPYTDTDGFSGKDFRRKSALPDYYKRFLGLNAFEAAPKEYKNKQPPFSAKAVHEPGSAPKSNHAMGGKHMKPIPPTESPSTAVTAAKCSHVPEVTDERESDQIGSPSQAENISMTSIKILSHLPVEKTDVKPLHRHDEVDGTEFPPPPPSELFTPSPLGNEQLASSLKPLPATPTIPAGSDKATLPVHSPTFYGISSAKPFVGSKASELKFRPMSASFKDVANSHHEVFFRARASPHA